MEKKSTTFLKNQEGGKIFHLHENFADFGVIKRDAFSGDLSKNEDLPTTDKELMNSKLKQLSMGGYGKKKTKKQKPKLSIDPADRLKGMIMADMGVNQSGGGILSESTLSTKVLPALLKKLKISGGVSITKIRTPRTR